jgi:hypothetical protein
MNIFATKFAMDTNPIIRVDRSIRPIASAYPQWEHELLHPELELAGPREFKLGTWGNWDDLNYWSPNGKSFYKYLMEKQILIFPNLIGLSDVLSIAARGMSFYRAYWKDKSRPPDGWRSVVQDAHGRLWIPRVTIYGTRVSVDWEDTSSREYTFAYCFA